MSTVGAAMARWRSRRRPIRENAAQPCEAQREGRASRNETDRLHRTVSIALFAAALSGAATAPDVLGNITMNRISTTNGVPAVVFPHWKHRSRFRCYACHPDIFEMRAGANDINMDALRNGEFCARCHDGRTAWAIGFDTCRECHSLGEM